MPRAGLSRDVLVGEGALLADEVGYERLTMAALAARLGVRLPSLYKHVGSLDELRAGIAVRSVDELGRALGSAAAGKSGSAALRAIAAAYRGYARDHPGRYGSTLRAAGPTDAALGMAGERVLAIVLAVLVGYGLAGPDAIDATRAVRSALHGFVALEAAGGFGLPQDVDRSFERLVEGVDVALSAWSRSGD